MNGLVELADPLQGTDSVPTFSNGATLPLITRPFAMTSWSLQTAEDRWFFHPHARQLQGVRATRQPSVWIGDYGHFVIMPQVGALLPTARERSSVYRIHESIIRPHYMNVFLGRYETRLELTATARCGFMRLTFPGTSAPRRIILDTFAGDSQIRVLSNGHSASIAGHTRANSGGAPDNFACYFVVELDCPIRLEESGLFHQEKVFEKQTSGKGERLGAYVSLDLKGDAPALVRIGTSFVSIEQARLNLEREICGRSFEQARDEAADDWDSMLGRVSIDALEESHRQTFYSCMYRALLFPRMPYEIQADGKEFHYSPYDGRIHSGVICTDNGFWDTHRTVYPLLSIIAPEELGRILDGWVNAYSEGGWFPNWASPGERGVMIGSHIDAVIADAVVKDVRGFDWQKAYEGLWKHATQVAPGESGRAVLDDYLRTGYVPADRINASVSRSLDYAYGDFCIGQIAKRLNRTDDHEAMTERAKNYRNLFDSSVGFMRGRNANGSWVEPFDEFEWGGPYVEGGAWQCSWAVPHDPGGLIELMGGSESFVRKLDRMLALPPRFHTGAYGCELHEMTEMASADFGQYAHSNQPVHHVLYLYALAGRPDRTQYWTRRVLQELYGQGVDGFPGDEDNGEMASWYILSALGFYPLCPGIPSYVLGSPLFRSVELLFPSGKRFLIEAKDAASDKPYVKQILLNGRILNRTSILHEGIVSGGSLEFVMKD